jgi:hypothetical protein
MTTIKVRIGITAVMALCLWMGWSGAFQAQPDVTAGTAVSALTQVLGRPTDHSITLSVLAPNDLESYVEYGAGPGKYTAKTAVAKTKSKVPFEVILGKLKPNTLYFYRLRHRPPDGGAYQADAEYSFHTQRQPGSAFVFDVQSDSHPERINRMFVPELYTREAANVQKDHPDFFISMGDDFSVDQGGPVNPERVAQIYINQREHFGMNGSSAPVFLVNGNHEQAAKYLLDGTPNNVAVWAGKSRNLYYPQPEPDSFYTGDKEPVEFVGLLRDYYAWTWGDALFIAIDPYWHSSVPVDNRFGEGPGSQKGAGGKGKAKGQRDTSRGRDMWDITLGEAQYRWLQRTLQLSKAKYKFVFAHHVLGTGRGAVERVDYYEWGGRNANGEWEFDRKRPGWELPIHQLMVKYGVSIFFQGHDHIFVRQERDGIVYQETPSPADPANEDKPDGQSFRAAYKTGDYLPAAGHLRVSVSAGGVKVDYVRAWLEKDLTPARKQGQVAFTYTVQAR